MSDDKIIAVVGPTAVGKTSASIALAKKIDAEIVCVDSLLVYREFDIGTAKPTLGECQGVHHHLIDVVDATERFTAGTFCRHAKEAIEDIQKRGKRVLLVGGSGLYLKALTQGMYHVPAIDPRTMQYIVHRIEEEGLETLYQELEKIDPVTAQKIHKNDQYRIARALEVYHGTGKRMSDFEKEHIVRPLTGVKKVGLNIPRHELHERIEKRTHAMIERGLLDEVGRLKEKYPADCKPLKSIGYKEALSFLNGHLTHPEMVEKIAQQTRALARRQITWFRADPEVEWQAPGSLETAL